MRLECKYSPGNFLTLDLETLFVCHNYKGGGATGILWVEVMDAAQHPTCTAEQRITPSELSVW